MLKKPVVFLTLAILAHAQVGMSEEALFRIGMIGLDTSHAPAFTKFINNASDTHGCKVVVAYAGGSPDIPSSIGRVEKYTNQMRDQFGVEIVDSISVPARIRTTIMSTE